MEEHDWRQLGAALTAREEAVVDLALRSGVVGLFDERHAE